MRWRGRRESENVEDQRNLAPVALAGGGLGTVVLVVLGLLLGVDPSKLLPQGGNAPQPAPPGAAAGGPEDEGKQFVSVVLADTEDVWTELFREVGKTYERPKLVLFTDQVRSGCGFASAQVGPFYCPTDAKVYLDLGFYDELSRRFGAPGEFARAYVIAHEIGHHVQNLLGISDEVTRLQRQASQEEANALSVRLELQADFLAGVWAHHAQKLKHILEPGDIESALNAASAIGDDRLQKRSQGYVVPDSFTHGTSEQRVRWFRKGFESGDIDDGDTFDTRRL